MKIEELDRHVRSDGETAILVKHPKRGYAIPIMSNDDPLLKRVQKQILLADWAADMPYAKSTKSVFFAVNLCDGSDAWTPDEAFARAVMKLVRNEELTEAELLMFPEEEYEEEGA